MVRGVDGSVLRLISPYVPFDNAQNRHVRLESTLAGSAVLTSPAIDDASQTAAHILRVRPVRDTKCEACPRESGGARSGVGV